MGAAWPYILLYSLLHMYTVESTIFLAAPLARSS